MLHLQQTPEKMNVALLKKGLLRIFIFGICCFMGPVILYQAFKNEGHPFFWPVFIIGIIIFFTAILFGFLGIKTIVSALLGKPKKRKKEDFIGSNQ